MNRRPFLEAASGLLLCLVGYFLAHRESYEVHTVLATAGGCQMATDVYEPRSGPPLGSVVLFHGLAANKKVMAFNAQEFANQELRVFVPDLPGHGRTPGPYSAERDDSCALALVRDLARRKALVPERTLLVGHSLGGAIAIRVAAHFPVSGVIALSPAPMRASPGFSAEMVPFHDVPALPPHSLVLSGQWEPGPITSLAQELVGPAAAAVLPAPASSSKYQMIPRTTHVSILFSQATFLELRDWSSRILGSNRDAPLPRNMPALGCILGIVGLSLLAPPFLREMNSAAKPAPDGRLSVPFWKKGLPVSAVAGFAAVLLLASPLIPIRLVGVFNGDYLALFLFLAGLLVLAVCYKSLPAWPRLPPSALASAAARALVLVLLFAGWFELTFYEAWPTPARLLRFPLLFVLLLPWHLAEEILIGPPDSTFDPRRLGKSFVLRSAVYVALFSGILYFHSGAILLFLLLGYFVVLSLLQRLASDLVRFKTQSSAAAAIFGAILLAAFALAIFPIA